MPPASKASKTRNVGRSIDKSEGKKSPVTGAAAHSREKHAEATPAELKERILKEKKKVASTFKSKKDQDGAIAAALKTPAGAKFLKAATAKDGRHTFKGTVSGSFKCSVAYPYERVDGKKDSFTSDALVREVTVVFDSKGGKLSPQTAYPSNFHF